MKNIYEKILENGNKDMQDYLSECRSNLTKEDYEEHTTFIESLPLSQRQKETLSAKVMLYHFIAQDALERLESMDTLRQNAMMERFKMLTPEKQREIITNYSDEFKLDFTLDELQEFAPNSVIIV